jgi:hypothetical protein
VLTENVNDHADRQKAFSADPRKVNGIVNRTGGLPITTARPTGNPLTLSSTANEKRVGVSRQRPVNYGFNLPIELQVKHH